MNYKNPTTQWFHSMSSLVSCWFNNNLGYPNITSVKRISDATTLSQCTEWTFKSFIFSFSVPSFSVLSFSVLSFFLCSFFLFFFLSYFLHMYFLFFSSFLSFVRSFVRLFVCLSFSFISPSFTSSLSLAFFLSVHIVLPSYDHNACVEYAMYGLLLMF